MTLIWIIALLAATVLGQTSPLVFLSVPTFIFTGNTNQILYEAANVTHPVSISLWDGPTGDLQVVQVLTSKTASAKLTMGLLTPRGLVDSSIGGNVTWTPSNTLPPGSHYVLGISQGDVLNFSKVFTIINQSGSATSTITNVAPEEPANTAVPSTKSTTSTTSSTASRTSTAGHAGSPQAAATTSSGAKIATHHGLSTGAAIGIGIGIAIVAIALISVGAFACYRRRKRGPKSAAVGQEPSSTVPQNTIAEAETRDRYEKDGESTPGEMMTRANTHEIDGKRSAVRHELAGS